MSGISIIRTGAANLASVVAAFRRLGEDSRIVDAPNEVGEDDRVVLPGVGAFETGSQAICQNGWRDFLRSRFNRDQPTLAICLGLQLLCQSSAESPGIDGLGIIPGTAQKFPKRVSIPQLGWNRVVGLEPNRMKEDYVYYANSYCLLNISELRASGWRVATSNHGVDFVAAIRRGNWLGCQFHPELSGSYGREILSSWIGISNKSAEAKSC